MAERPAKKYIQISWNRETKKSIEISLPDKTTHWYFLELPNLTEWEEHSIFQIENQSPPQLIGQSSKASSK